MRRHNAIVVGARCTGAPVASIVGIPRTVTVGSFPSGTSHDRGFDRA